MQRSTVPRVLSVAVGLIAVGVLAGCAGGGAATPSATATATETVTATPTPSSTPSSSASGSSGTGSSSGGVARCAASSLSLTEQPGSGGAAGSTIIHLAFTNTGSSTCTLQGWPGVSFVGGGDGQQIGAAASLDRSSPHPTVTLRPGQVAVAPLKIGQAGNYSAADCSPVTPDGYRVYPPGSKTSLFLKDEGRQACRSSDAPLLSVQALVPEGQATD
ncbi:DUF4232 domain-containing protein [Curtobacterium sp. 458]|uniref:DUF4232 domain-containing protein n=1 Tax=Curtobacterium sp. 458 TaxID=3050069 RepID=UPI0025B2CE3F|nr:DUF4232 domain-containing protein [Curtobacterium sp. 458]WJY00959.1 DUF4232 domain-containing protein [Curtobacterium sp. 458]